MYHRLRSKAPWLAAATLILLSAGVVLSPVLAGSGRSEPHLSQDMDSWVEQAQTDNVPAVVFVGAMARTQSGELPILRRLPTPDAPLPSIDFLPLLTPGVQASLAPANPHFPSGCGYVVLVPNRDTGNRIRDSLLAHQTSALTYWFARKLAPSGVEKKCGGS